MSEVEREMKLWLLRPIRDLPDDVEDPWEPWYDKSFGHVVAAPDEDTARQLANQHGGDETGKITHIVYRSGGNPWLDPDFSTCIPLRAADYDEPTHVLRDFASA